MTDEKVYIVVGHSGEYSDSRDWLVCAFEDENLARQHVLNLSNKFRELYARFNKLHREMYPPHIMLDREHFESHQVEYEEYERKVIELAKEINTFDPNLSKELEAIDIYDYAFTSLPNYTYKEVELK